MTTCDIGLVGLGTMGAALALNLAEKGFRVAVWNRTGAVTERFHREAGVLAEQILPCESQEALVAALKLPRAILLMVPAGAAVDAQIDALRPLLAPEDLLIDGGNANFHDTNRRMRESGGPFLGIGVSGGEEGARHGPAIMGGGPRALWDRVAPMLTAIAARHEGTPCADWMGEDGAGHFVKTVHNGIEYADMQMIAEVYGVMRDGLGMGAAAIGEAFTGWNEGPLRSYLVEIAGEVAAAVDPVAGGPMLDVILDRAGQKGTGAWTVIEAQHLGVPVPAIDAAVTARNLSSRLDERRAGEARFGAAPRHLPHDLIDLSMLESALIAGKIVAYAQGFAMIGAARAAFGWSLDLPRVARVWRAGCIIRSAMLDEMAAALAEDAERSLILAPGFAARMAAHSGALRQVVAQAALHGIAAPALASGLAWFDTMRTARGTANMLQGLRDRFGAHGFERTDGIDAPHGPWGG